MSIAICWNFWVGKHSLDPKEILEAFLESMRLRVAKMIIMIDFQFPLILAA